MKLSVGMALLGVAMVTPASAAVFDFTYTGTGVFASGQLTTTDVADPSGFFSVLGISGTRNGVAIGRLTAPGGFGENDNLFKPNFEFFTNGGVTFVSGGLSYNLFTTSGVCPGFTAEAASDRGFGCTTLTPIQFSASAANAVPEPATWAMMIGGFGLVGAAMRRRRTAASAQLV